MQKADQQGFTLIEMSIVLVIIGLIVGGVLAGQTLIRAAQIRGVIKEEMQFETAVRIFMMKYDCLPGDCANASQFLPGVTNGDGDWSICGSTKDYATVCATGPYESFYAIQHLAAAELLEWPVSTPLDASVQFNGTMLATPGRNIPASASYSGGGWTIISPAKFVGSAWNDPYCAAAINPIPNQIIFAGEFWGGQPGLATPAGNSFLSGADASSIDSKIDDGQPFTGKVQAFNNAGYGNYYTNLTGGCTNANMSSGTYVISGANTGPGLIFLTNFETHE